MQMLNAMTTEKESPTTHTSIIPSSQPYFC
jgi:hypothetical protein